MEIGIAMAIDRLINTLNEFDPSESFEVQLTNAELIRECAAVIANATEEEVIDALKHKKQLTA